MSWQLHVKSAETVLESTRIPSSEEIITLIKRINPTSLQLCESDREQGYRIKNRLQNLLLENYGETFHLAPHPYSPDIVLIKHKTLPSIDACHADFTALSAKALDTVGNLAPVSTGNAARGEAKGEPRKPSAACSAKEVLRNAELLLEQYEYPQAEEMLAAIRITDSKELPTLQKAAELLMGEMGAYQTANELLLAQPRRLFRDKAVRELLALTYYGNGMIPEARALLDAAHPGDLGKSALYAYADISFKDGKPAQAYRLLKLSDEKEGFITAHASLRKEIEEALLAEAEPFLQQAQGAYAGGDLAQAESLVQKALSLYPNYRQARRLAGEIEAGKSAGELERLWEQFRAGETAAERLDLLAQLLERDKGHGEKIRELMTRERARQKQETLDERLHTLQACTARQEWEDSFDILLWLSRQGDEECYRRACGIHPYFPVLYQNRRLLRLPDAEAKKLWLGFVRLMWLVGQGQTEGCWELAQPLKPYFHSSPAFREAYDRLLELERVKARDAIDRLMTRLEELQESEETEEPAGALAEAKGLVARMRKRLVLLPAEETAAYKEYAEAIIHRMEAATDGEEGIMDYRAALLLGNSAKAAQLRESLSRSWPEEMFKMVDAEVAETFAISAEPINLVVSPELIVDLATQAAPAGLTWFCSSPRHVLFREDDETILVVNVRRKSATRYRSAKFKDLALSDFLLEKDLFLFLNMHDKISVWRAILSETESRFTAVFEINRHFVYRAGACFEGFFMSGGKDNAYFAFIREGDRVRVVKQTIGLASNVVGTFELTGEVKGAYRLSHQPDRFVVSTENNTAVLESNLTQPRGCSRVGTSQMLEFTGIDIEAGRIYALGDGIVNVLNHKLFAVKQYLGAVSAAHMLMTTPAQICVEKHMALFSLNGRSLFYNMQTNQFSQKFSNARMTFTETPSRWFYWDFDRAKDTLMMKDITDEVETLLQWQVLLPEDDNEEVAAEFVEKLENPEYFSIVKATDLPEDGSAMEADPAQASPV